MELSRRNLSTVLPVVGMTIALGACAVSANGSSNTFGPPTLTQVQSWVKIAQAEMPVFLADIQSTNMLSGPNLAKAQVALNAFNGVATQILSASTTTPSVLQLVNTAGGILATVMSYIPAAAPFVPFVVLLQGVITAFVTQSAVQTPSGPTPVPAVPTPAALAGLHRATVRWTLKR